MELICSVPAGPLPMQILALANNAGKANQVSSRKPSCRLLWLQGLPPVSTTCEGLDLPLQFCANAGCSDDLCSIG